LIRQALLVAYKKGKAFQPSTGGNMQINVICEKHNVSMVPVREWTSRGGDIEITVEPCPECIEEAIQSVKPIVNVDSYCQIHNVFYSFVCPHCTTSGSH
jgi:hypothetical protein